MADGPTDKIFQDEELLATCRLEKPFSMQGCPICNRKTYIFSIRKLRMRNCRFPIRKGGIFRHEKEIEGLRGGVHEYAAQVSLKIDAVMTEKNPFRT